MSCPEGFWHILPLAPTSIQLRVWNILLLLLLLLLLEGNLDDIWYPDDLKNFSGIPVGSPL